MTLFSVLFSIGWLGIMGWTAWHMFQRHRDPPLEYEKRESILLYLGGNFALLALLDVVMQSPIRDWWAIALIVLAPIIHVYCSRIIMLTCMDAVEYRQRRRQLETFALRMCAKQQPGPDTHSV